MASSTVKAASGFEAMLSTQSTKENDEERTGVTLAGSAVGKAVAKQAMNVRKLM